MYDSGKKCLEMDNIHLFHFIDLLLYRRTTNLIDICKNIHHLEFKVTYLNWIRIPFFVVGLELQSFLADN